MRPARSHRADVTHAGRERADDGRHVELGVVRQHAHRVARSERRSHSLEIAIRPVHHDLVGRWKTRSRREHRTGVTDRDDEAEDPGDLDERPREVNGPEHDQFRGRYEGLDEHFDLLTTCLTVRAVVASSRDPALEHRRGVTSDDSIEFGVAQCAQHHSLRTDQEFRGERGRSARCVGDARHRDQADRRSGENRAAKLSVDLPAHQSSGSTKRCTVPPHVSPTAKAWSSE